MAGLLSFFSPCIVPLIPAYFSFITGYSLDELTGAGELRHRKKIIVSTIAYILGFSLVFILMGASASFFMGTLVFKYKEWIRIAGSVFIIILGLHLSGIMKIRFLEFEKRLNIQKKPVHLFGTFLVGMAFGAGWSPCIGPLLGSILIIAGSQESVGQGILLLSVYSAGLALPFLILSLFINFLITFIKRTTKVIRYVNVLAGALLLVVGLLLLTNKLSILTVT